MRGAGAGAGAIGDRAGSACCVVVRSVIVYSFIIAVTVPSGWYSNRHETGTGQNGVMSRPPAAREAVLDAFERIIIAEGERARDARRHARRPPASRRAACCTTSAHGTRSSPDSSSGCIGWSTRTSTSSTRLPRARSRTSSARRSTWSRRSTTASSPRCGSPRAATARPPRRSVPCDRGGSKRSAGTSPTRRWPSRSRSSATGSITTRPCAPRSTSAPTTPATRSAVAEMDALVALLERIARESPVE